MQKCEALVVAAPNYRELFDGFVREIAERDCEIRYDFEIEAEDGFRLAKGGHYDIFFVDGAYDVPVDIFRHLKDRRDLHRVYSELLKELHPDKPVIGMSLEWAHIKRKVPSYDAVIEPYDLLNADAMGKILAKYELLPPSR